MLNLKDIGQYLERKLISKAIRDVNSQFYRARLMLGVLGISGIIVGCLLGHSLVKGDHESWIDLSLFIGHLLVCTPVVMIRSAEDMKRPCQALALLAAVQLVIATGVTGGPRSIVLYALPVLPIFLASMVNIKTNLISSSIAIGGVTTIFLVDLFWFPFPEVSNTVFERVFTIAWVVFLCLGIAVYSQANANRLLSLAREELAQKELAQVELANVIESKDRFVAYMSHEMRNALTAIVGASELLGMSSTKSDHPRYLESLKSSSNSLREIVDTVLDFSKLGSGQEVLELSPTSVQSVCSDLTSQFSANAETKMLSLELEISEDAPSYVMANKVRLRQVLANLLSNGIKYSNARSTVKLSVTRAGNNSNAALFAVEDTGIGIPSEDQKKIFVPYERSYTGSGRTGTGLGLPIAQALLEKMGTSMDVESEVGVGSKFYFVLDSVSVQLLDREHLNNQIVLEGRSVLVSDDNPEASVVVLGMLGSMGCVVRHAKNGEEAISFYKEFGPDYVLMDIQMPIINGMAAAREIRNFEKLNNLNRACILAVTGELNTTDVLAEDVFSGFLQKPFSQSDLLSVISRVV